jgi:lysophospholipase L1-like esterase
VLDLTEKFINAGFEKLYIDDQYGGHLSAKGNQLVANEISAWLELNRQLTV